MDELKKDNPAQEPTSFLPNFCNIRTVFSVVMLAELLALILTLASSNGLNNSWRYLSLVSLYIQWITLLSAATLCLLRPALTRFADQYMAVLVYVLLICIVALVSEVTFWANNHLQIGLLGSNPDHLEFLGRNVAISAIANFIILRYLYLQHQLRRNIEAELQHRLQALQARIRPHFLFNSLNTIASLIRHRPKQAEDAVEDLADLFRASLESAGTLLPLAQEIETSQRYIQIEQLRLGKRLKIEWDISTIPEDAALPPLTLQPLLENAIYHGVEQLDDGGTIHCRGYIDGATIHLNIINPVNLETNTEKRAGLNMAMDNIRQRLQAHFGDKARLNVARSKGYHQVELKFPYIPVL